MNGHLAGKAVSNSFHAIDFETGLVAEIHIDSVDRFGAGSARAEQAQGTRMPKGFGQQSICSPVGLCAQFIRQIFRAPGDACQVGVELRIRPEAKQGFRGFGGNRDDRHMRACHGGQLFDTGAGFSLGLDEPVRSGR